MTNLEALKAKLAASEAELQAYRAGKSEVYQLRVDLAASEAERKRLQGVLRSIIDLDHHNMGPESKATTIARKALTA